MEVETSGKYIDKTTWGIWQLIPDATYRFNKTIATATIRFIVTVAIVVYKGSKLVVYRMLTHKLPPIITLFKNSLLFILQNHIYTH